MHKIFRLESNSLPLKDDVLLDLEIHYNNSYGNITLLKLFVAV